MLSILAFLRRVEADLRPNFVRVPPLGEMSRSVSGDNILYRLVKQNRGLSATRSVGRRSATPPEFRFEEVYSCPCISDTKEGKLKSKWPGKLAREDTVRWMRRHDPSGSFVFRKATIAIACKPAHLVAGQSGLLSARRWRPKMSAATTDKAPCTANITPVSFMPRQTIGCPRPQLYGIAPNPVPRQAAEQIPAPWMASSFDDG